MEINEVDKKEKEIKPIQDDLPVIELDQSDLSMLFSGETIVLEDFGVCISVDELFCSFIKEAEIKPFAQRGTHVIVSADVAQRYNKIFLVPFEFNERERR